MIYAIVPAAGLGTRMRMGALAQAKQYLALGTGTVLTTTLQNLWSSELFAGLVVVVPEDDVPHMQEELQHLPFGQAIRVVAGGKERQDSVRNGLGALPSDATYAVVHDGVRPLVTGDVIRRVVTAAHEHGAATAAIPVNDTVKRADGANRIVQTIDRTGLWSIQTPQAFEVQLLREAHTKAWQRGERFTDDAGVVEALGHAVYVANGDPRNIKLTRPEDLKLVGMWLHEEEASSMRVGIGYDVHRLVEGRPLILGGVTVPHSKGLLGHSDADVLAHAITDALLGAAALGDIGQHFPDTDPKYKDADSIELLKAVVALLEERGYKPVQVDAVLAAQRPRLAPYIPQIRESLAAALRLPAKDVGVKATTTEGLGFVGREEGMEARCVVTIRGCRVD